MPTSYVQDFAGVIDAGSKQQMEQLSREVYQQAHATIVVVTIHSLDGESIEQFATDLEDKWKVGPKGTDRGVLMILAINDRKRRIEVGYGLEGILNDAKVGDIGRTMVPWLQRGEYGQGLLEGQQQIAKVIAADANVTLAPMEQPVRQPATATWPQRLAGHHRLLRHYLLHLPRRSSRRRWLAAVVHPRQHDGRRPSRRRMGRRWWRIRRRRRWRWRRLRRRLRWWFGRRRGQRGLVVQVS